MAGCQRVDVRVTGRREDGCCDEPNRGLASQVSEQGRQLVPRSGEGVLCGNPYWALLAFVPGFFLLFFSNLMGLGRFLDPAFGRTVGFSYSLGWLFITILVFPLSLSCAITTYQRMTNSLRGVFASRMVVNENLEPKSDEREFLDHWNHLITSPSSRRAFAFLAIATFAFCLLEWWAYSGLPLTRGNAAGLPPERRDWQVGALILGNAGTHLRAANFLLSLSAFLLQAVIYCCVWAFIIAQIAFCVFIHRLATGRMESTLLIPSLDDPDIRLGFGKLEAPLLSGWVTIGVAILGLFLIRLQDAYLLSPGTYKTSYDFLRDVILKGMISPDILNVGNFGYSGISVFIEAVLLIAAGVLAFVSVSRAAGDARDLLLNYIRRGAKGVAFPPEAATRLGALPTWPSNFALMLCVIASAMLICMVFYRLTSLFLVLGMVYLLWNSVEILRQSFNKYPKEPSMPKEVCKVLFVSSDPSDAARLGIQIELRKIQEELQRSIGRDGFAFEFCPATRTIDLSRELLQKRPAFLHFSGHGMRKGAICLQDDAGQTVPVSAAKLGSILAPIKLGLRCVLLNACYTHAPAQADAILEHVPYVIGMSDSISDAAAIAYSAGFYQAIFHGVEIPAAHDLGCAQVPPGEHNKPKLLRLNNP